MKFIIDRDALLGALQVVQGVVERRQTIPILSHVLLSLHDQELSITATDMEVELNSHLLVGETHEAGAITVPARKLIDICRTSSVHNPISFQSVAEQATIVSGRSRFVLSTLPAAEFPSSDTLQGVASLDLEEGLLKRLIELTYFAMAQQDVRYYLNGLLIEVTSDELRCVATDGHRLAFAKHGMETALAREENVQAIIPRKGVTELMRMLGSATEPVVVTVGTNAVQAQFATAQFTSKLIDGRYPEYGNVIPDPRHCERELVAERDGLRQALARAAIIANERHRAVRLVLETNTMRIVANNPEQEEIEEQLEAEYRGDPLEIGFNVTYLMDAIAAIPTRSIRMFFFSASNSCLITPEGRNDCLYVVMPMRL
jgi:DNA polymerase-3 subunit beta